MKLLVIVIASIFVIGYIYLMVSYF
ncbi:hypothetical protein NMYAN_190001 [Nitrosomonas nitrosa]|uniref:Uncharacterized protein n=1 Tax=Nitrosomonas nitrosa TaxID=52442 RepID=A0A8H8Z126_9PROT|nr:hypothetical protein NMYAN_190001 [Nitrosomonas nitrosa]